LTPPPRSGDVVMARLLASAVSSEVAVRPDVVAVCDCRPVKLSVLAVGDWPTTVAFA
jgi:hypothetical protein